MSEFAGDIIDNVLTLCRRSGSESDRTRYWKLLNTIYFRLCRKYSWVSLRDKVTLDFSSMIGIEGLQLPSNLFGIDSVYDTAQGFEYYHRDRNYPNVDEKLYRFYTYKPEYEDLFFSDDATVNQDENTFTCDSLATDYTGEYVRFGTDLGFYKLTAEKTFSPTYRGSNLGEVDIRIRPCETENILTIDFSDTIMTENKVDVYYWKAPLPLHRDSDPILLPGGKILEIMLLRELPEAKSYRPVSDSEIDKTLASTLDMNPEFSQNRMSRDRTGNIFTFSRPALFKDRK